MQIFLQGLYEGIVNGSVTALVAMGVALVWGVMGILSFSQGEFLMLGMYVAYFMHELLGVEPLMSLPIAALTLFVLGWVIYKTIISRALKGPKLSQRLITFALSLVLVNLALLSFGGEFRTIKTSINGSIDLGILIVSKQKLIPLIVSVALAAAMFLFLNYTRKGKAIQATSMDKQAAGLMGIDTDNTFAFSYALSAALAGAGGCIITYYFYMFPNVGSTFTLWSFLAVAMGGVTSIPGAFISGLAMGIIDTMTGLYVGTAVKYIGVCVLYMVIVSIKPDGLFGRK